MKRYKSIVTPDGSAMATRTVDGLKKLAKKGKVKAGNYSCICPNGNIHNYEIVVSEVNKKFTAKAHWLGIFRP